MAYEVYQRSNFRTEEPALSLVPDGRIALNVAATRRMAEAGVKSVLLLWDSQKRKIAIRAAPLGDKNAYVVSYAGHNRATLAAKSFFAYVGWKSGKRQKVRAAWDPKLRMLEASLPIDMLDSK